jgi:phosphopantothenoylcysteine decarboxylase/phosphopantothenate--cysteine ligase
MLSSLRQKQIVLGVTGGISAYKSADLVRRLREAGAVVQVVMTENAQQFITPLTMQAVSGLPVRRCLFDSAAEAAMGHIELARWADLIVVAPASADFMARLAAGRADDLLTTLCLASEAPLALAPSMNQAMWKNTLTQKNLQVLKAQGVAILGPDEGSQACGDVGPGRMLEPLAIREQLGALFETGLMSGLRLLITAGPTQEAIDPVRFLANTSSGKMGYALAQAALEAGAEVRLVSGPVSSALLPPPQAAVIAVTTAEEMRTAVNQEVGSCDIFLAVAAVADYRCKQQAVEKITKDAAFLTLELERTPDIVAEVAKQKKRPFIVGFAAETEKLLERAKEKRRRKGMDMIIANQVGKGLCFGSDENAVTVLWASSSEEKSQEFLRSSKLKLARQLITLIAETYRERMNNHDGSL